MNASDSQTGYWNRATAILPTLLAGLLYFLAFPPVACWPLAFVCMVPFFSALHTTRSAVARFGHGFLLGCCIVAGLGYWMFDSLVNAYGVPLPASLLFMALGVFIPIATVYGLMSVVWGFLRFDSIAFHLLVAPALWTAAEYSLEMIPVLVPWTLIGYAAAGWETYAQIADLTGIFGVAFLLAMANGAVFSMLHMQKRSSSSGRIISSGRWTAALVLIFVLALPTVYGLIRVKQIDGRTRQRVQDHGRRVVLVQGNFSQQERWSGMGFHNRVRQHLRMSGCDSGSGPCLVIWPETVLNSSPQMTAELFDAIRQSLGGNCLIAGGLRPSPDKNGIYNAAYLVPPAGSIQWYDKNILLPYAESVPGIDLLGAYFTAPAEFLPGRMPPILDTPQGRAGICICLEALYGDYLRRAVIMGAGFIVNLSNDGWFGRSSMPVMHLTAARMRAIENRRFVLRAANNGISAVIAPTGRLAARSALFKQERIEEEFTPFAELTFYSRWGNWIVYAAALIILARLFVIVFWKRHPEEGSSPDSL